MATCFNPSKKHSDRERWICIYPAYINSKKTRAQGRVIPKEKAVENPTHQEIRDVLVAQGFSKFGIESKMYCRERSKESLYRGRIRVQLKDDDGTPLNPNYPSRESVMLMIADLIPKLKTRAGKQGGSDQPQQQSSSNPKKGKGKRR